MPGWHRTLCHQAGGLGLGDDLLAGLAGVTEDYLSQIERGLKTPSTALLHRLARVLGVPTSVLFGESAVEPATSAHPLSAAIHTALALGGEQVSPDHPLDLQDQGYREGLTK